MAIEKVREYFKGTELDGKVIELKESSATVELAAAALKIEPDRIAKSLSFLLGEEPILVIMSGKSKADNAKYRAKFGLKAKMIPFDQVESFIGHAPGGVCPFAVNDNVKVYLDVSLKKYDEVWPAAGSENSCVKVTIEQLEKFSKFVEWVDVSKPMEVK